MRVPEVRDFSKRGDALPTPNLVEVQIESYQKFFQKDVEVAKRKNDGLEALLREVFPIESYDGNLRLEYISYDLSEPRYTTDECRALRLTFGMPFRIQVRFVRKDKDEVMEDSIYLVLDLAHEAHLDAERHSVGQAKRPALRSEEHTSELQ